MATARIMMILIPDLDKDPRAAKRTIEQNFRQIVEVVNNAVNNGALIGPETVTLAMLAVDAKTLVGDVNGLINANALKPAIKTLEGDVTGAIGTAAEGGATSVVRLRGKDLPVPGPANDGQVLGWDDTAQDFVFIAASGGSSDGRVNRIKDTDYTLEDGESLVVAEYLQMTGASILRLNGDAALRIIG